LSKLVGKSLLTANGEEWANHRQIFAPAFRVEALKGLVNKITKSITSRLDIWEEKVQDGGGFMELEVHHEICIITMEAISHMLFSNIDQKTEQMFFQLKTLFETVSQATTNRFFTIPGYRYAFKFVIILKQVVNQYHKNLVFMQMLPILL
jgi:cytochrome P450